MCKLVNNNYCYALHLFLADEKARGQVGGKIQQYLNPVRPFASRSAKSVRVFLPFEIQILVLRGQYDYIQ